MMQEGMLESTTFSSSKIGSGDADDLESSLSGIGGVRDVQVNGDNHSVTVRYDPTMVDENAIREAVERQGFSIDNTSDQLSDSGNPTGYNVDAPLT